MSRAAALLHAHAPNAAIPAISPLLAREPVVQRSCAACDKGKCPACEEPAALGAVQAKLTIGAPDDPLEKEADEVADQVMRMPDAAAPIIAAPHREDSLHLRRRPAAALAAIPTPVVNLPTASSAGVPLPHSTRSFFEQRLSRDLGHVRIHDDGNAQALARQLNARAFTYGRDVYFAAGEYDPVSNYGRRLLAHELAHIFQQGRAPNSVQRKQPITEPLIYSPTVVTKPTSRKVTIHEAKQLLAKAVKDGDLTAWGVSGAQAGSDEEIMLHMILWSASGPHRWGTEADLIAPIGFPKPGGGPEPVGKVTVRIDTTGKGQAVLLSAGPVQMPKGFKKKQDAENELRSVYGISAIKDTAGTEWKLEELNLVLGAFKRIPAGDRSVLKGVILERVDTFPTDTPTQITEGEFESNPQAVGTSQVLVDTLRLASSVFTSTPTGFVGGQGNEAPDAYRKILHEVGHAVASKTFRDSTVAYFKASETAAPLVDQYKKAPDAKKPSLYDAREAAVKASNQAVEQVEQATARPMLLTRAQTMGASAAAALQAAKSNAQSNTPASNALRGAATIASNAIGGFAAAVEIQDEVARTQVVTSSRLAADNAVKAAELERKKLQTSKPGDLVLKAYSPVVASHRSWFDALALVLDAGDRSGRLQKFLDFVTEKNIKPLSAYAKREWPGKPGEFFAETFTLYLNDPDYLKDNYPLLFDWFQAGKYR